MDESIFRSELFNEFKNIYGDDGKIDKLVKKYKEEIKDPYKPKFFNVQNYTCENKSDDKKVSNAKINNINDINDTKNLIQNIKNKIEIAGKAKVSKSNLNFVDKCYNEWEKFEKKDDDENSEELNLEDYTNYSNPENHDSIFNFYREVGELTAIIKTLTQNHVDSMKFQSLYDIYH